MRKLMWFALGFGVACALAVYLLRGWILIGVGIAALLSIFVAFLGAKKYHAFKILAAISLGLLIGIIWYQAYDGIYLKHMRALDGQSLDLVLTATDFSFETDYGITVDAVAVIDERSVNIRAYLHEMDALSPGDKISGAFRLRYTGYGGIEDPTHHSAERVFFLGYPEGDHVSEPAGSSNFIYFPAYLRNYLLGAIEKIFPTDIHGFVKALLLGDTSDLSYTQDSQLTVSGIRHVAAVSGLHVSILFAMVYLLTGKKEKLTALFGIPVLVFFAAMAGFSPSVTRACLMQVLVLIGMLLQKEYDPATALSFACLTMLAINPLVVTSVGFQLSVASVAGILLFARKITQWILDPKRLGRWRKSKGYALIRDSAVSVGVSIGATVMTTPLTAFYFGNVSLVGMLTNVLCMWAITFSFCAIVVCCIIGAIYLPLGKCIAWIVAWPIRYVLGVAGVISAFPLASLYTESMFVIGWLIFVYILLVVFLFTKNRRVNLLSCCAALSLCVALMASWAEPLFDNYRVTVIDMGQGQCILLQSGGRTYMIDCGGDYDSNAANKAAAVLLSQGVTRLDGMILSHYDRDHVGGAPGLLSRVPADILVLPSDPENIQRQYQVAEAHSGEPIYVYDDMVIQWGDARISVYASQSTRSSNERSLCVLFQTEKCDILITGDRSQKGELELMERILLPKLDALVVGHHGAESSTSVALLEVTQPKMAVISVGEGNYYGHPDAAVLERLRDYGCRIRRTDLEGTIVIRG